MKKGLFKKGLLFVIIALFIGASITFSINKIVSADEPTVISDFFVEVYPIEIMAGAKNSKFHFNTSIVDSDGYKIGWPEETGLHVRIFNGNGVDVTGSIGNISATEIDGKVNQTLYDKFVQKPGTYTVYAYNDTHNSVGRNATLLVKPVEVFLEDIDNVHVYSKQLIWMGDDNVSVSFSVEYDGIPVDGLLRIDNMSIAGSGISTYNKTWTNTSFSPVIGSTTGVDTGGNVSNSYTVTNGVVNVNDITPDYLPDNYTCMNITFYFKPSTSGSAWAKSDGKVIVKMPDVDVHPYYVRLGKHSNVEITVTGRGEPLNNKWVSTQESVFGMLPKVYSGLTDTDGKIIFNIFPLASGEIFVEIENKTSPAKLIAGSFMDPIADAGKDQIVSIGDLVTLDGSDSYDFHDPHEDLTFFWEKISEDPCEITINEPENNISTFTASICIATIPPLNPYIRYTFQLTVTNTFGFTDTDIVNVTVIEDLDHAVFVSDTHGYPRNPGTSERPVKTLDDAFEIAMDTTPYSDIYVHVGEYDSDATLVLRDNMSLLGGFDAELAPDGKVRGWRKTETSNPTVFSGAATAIEIFDIENLTVIERFTIESSPGAYTGGTGENSIGIYIHNANNKLILKGNTILAEKGGNGAPGVDGIRGNNGTNGSRGGHYHHKNPYNLIDLILIYRDGGAGGQGGIIHSTGENAPSGGKGGRACFADGFPGVKGDGIHGGPGGAGGIYIADPDILWGTAEHGTRGYDGAYGYGGSGGDKNGTIINNRWVGSRGQNGTNGTAGYGGGGGGGGWGKLYGSDYAEWQQGLWTGSGGGGGGGAGSGGTFGSGGYGGGGSFGIFMSDASPSIYYCTIETLGGGNGGDGGVGGFGGCGGYPGFSGAYYPYECDSSPTGWCLMSQKGGYGGAGGTGGSGGSGGGGGGGISTPLYRIGDSDYLNYSNLCYSGPGGLGGSGGFPDLSEYGCGFPPIYPFSYGEDGENGAEPDEAEAGEDLVVDVIPPGGKVGGGLHPPSWGYNRIGIEYDNSDIVLTLFSPSGIEINRSTTDPDIIHDNGPGYEYYILYNPEPGDWSYEIYGLDVPPEGEEVTLTLNYLPNNNPPIALCKDVVVAAGLNCMAYTSIDNGSYDPDGYDPITITQTPSGPYPLGDTIVTLTIDDGKGGSDTCQATVTVVDETPPTVTVSDDFIHVTQETHSGTLVNLSAVAEDICDPSPSISWSHGPSAVFPVGETIVTVTATDAAGNICSFNITVIVDDAPVVNINQNTFYYSIQDSINDSNPGDTITVENGMYIEHLVINKNIQLIGEDKYSTILWGNSSGSVISTQNLDSTSLISDFTIMNGNATYGGGMYNYQSSPTVTNCIFYNNSADQGGGMYNDQYSQPTIDNCVFYANSADIGGGMALSRSNPIIKNCTFKDNIAEIQNGGGMNIFRSSPTIINCTFDNNTAITYGGGMYITHYSNPIVSSCIFNNNYASSGGAIRSAVDSEPIIVNNIFENNSETVIYSVWCADIKLIGNNFINNLGGVILSGMSNGNVTDNTFSGNQIGIVVSSSANIIIAENIVKNNNNDGIRVQQSSNNITIRDNLIFDNTWNGIAIQNSDLNTVDENTIYNNDKTAVLISNSDENFVLRNNISDNGNGINIISSSVLNNVSFNNLSNNGIAAIYIDNADENFIYNNDVNVVDAEIIPSGLVGYWEMYEASGSVIHDNSTNNIDGFIVDATWGDGIIGSGLVFDGVGDYLQILYNSSIDFTNSDFSISSWFKLPSDAPDLVYSLFGLGNPWGVNGKGFLVTVDCSFYSSNGYLCIRTYIGNGIGNPKSVPLVIKDSANKNIDVRDDQWHHIMVTFDRDDEVNIYLDGRILRTANHDISGQQGGDPWTYDLIIGGYANAVTLNNFNGTIDEVRIFNKTISNEEIHRHYLGGILMRNSENNSITRNKLSNSLFGIELFSSNYNNIEYNMISNNFYGIYLDYSNNNTIENNTLINNVYGIFDPFSNFNIIKKNFIHNNRYGIFVQDSQENSIVDNSISENKIGIILDENSNNNEIFNNNFVENIVQAEDEGSNSWDDGEGTGNFWSDYTGEDEDGDGIGDTSHQDLDQYPIITPPSNSPPVADADGPYFGAIGEEVIFDASDSYDYNEGDELQYRWDFENDGDWNTDWSSNPISTCSWDEEYSGIVVVEVSDGEYTDTDSSTVTVMILEATIVFEPETLNLLSQGKPVTVYIELPDDYDVNNIDRDSILLNGIVPAKSSPWEIDDADKDGILDLMVKFDRSSVQAILKVGEQESIVITGLLFDGSAFGGEDRIRAIKE